jgi:hypothetical protein
MGNVAHLRSDHHLSVREPHRGPVAIRQRRLREKPRDFRRVGRKPIERNLVARQEPAQIGGCRIPARTDHGHARLMRLGGNGLQSPDALARQRAHLLRHFLRCGRDRVIFRKLDAHDARWFGGAISSGKRRAERDRHFTE